MIQHCRRSLLGAALVVLPAALVAQQPVAVSGRVTSDAGAPIPSASVFLETMGIGALTNGEGRYSFTVPAARAAGQTVTLTARVIGYRPVSTRVTLTSGAQIAHDFSLAANPLNLGEVVITGAGTQTTEEKLGTARSNVDSTSIVHAMEPNVVNALAAKAPNVQVLSSSGEPGASTYIQIRGLTSIASGTGQPLFVVDGTPIDNSTTDTPMSGGNGGTIAENRALDLNPADIENVEILKGAAASAIYGSRAGQGVVLITTKRGRGGQTRYSLRSSTSWDDVANVPNLQSTFGVGTAGVTPSCYVKKTPNCRLGFGSAGSWGPVITSPKYDHTTEVFQTGHTFDNNLSVSGGSDRTSFYLSAGALDQRGFIIGPNNNLNRYSVRFNGSQQVFSTLRVGINASYANTTGAFEQSRNNISGLLLGAWRTPIDFNNKPFLDPVYGLHRSYRFPFPAPGSERLSRNYDNPLFSANEDQATSAVGRAFGNINADYFPISWLHFNETLGADFSNDDRLEALPLSASGAAVAGNGQVIRASLRNFAIDHNLTATANYDVSPSFKGTVTLGQNLNSTQYRQQGEEGTILIAAQPFNLLNTTNLQPPVDNRTEIRIESYFGQVTADLFDQLFLTGALRNDGVSTFGANKKRAWFPKGSVAWSFLRNPETLHQWVTFGKLRAAYGQSGTQPAPYLTTTPYIAGSLFEGGWGPSLGTQQNGQGGYVTSATLGNPNLGPERVGELELGGDFGLVRDKADVSFTYYHEKTTDAILIFPIAPSGGFTQQLRNAGSLQNIGYELALNLRPIRTQLFGWDLGVQWARNRNKVLSLKGASQVVLSSPFGSLPQSIVQEGQPMGVWLSNDFVRCGRGVVVNGANIDNTVCQGAPKGALYIGSDGYPVVDQQGQYIVADPNPDWTGSIRTNISVGKFTVGGLVDIRRGGAVYNGTRLALNHFGRTAESAKYRQGTWVFGKTYFGNEKVVGPGVGTPVALGQAWFQGPLSVFNGPQASAFEDGGFTKLREVSVAYLWDTPLVDRLGFSSVELRLAGRNLHTWTKYSGVDPETSVGSAAFSVIRGVDYFNIPQTRSYVLTFTLNR
jgi:TonB-linked SusC/RagA family outer membrane protein